MGSLVPLAVALALLFVPVRNPGVQRCGSPAVFLFSGSDNVSVVAEGRSIEEVSALRAQPTCTGRSVQRFNWALVAGGVFMALALAGVVLGLVDDRRELHEAPDFDTLVPDMPHDAA